MLLRKQCSHIPFDVVYSTDGGIVYYEVAIAIYLDIQSHAQPQDQFVNIYSSFIVIVEKIKIFYILLAISDSYLIWLYFLLMFKYLEVD